MTLLGGGVGDNGTAGLTTCPAKATAATITVWADEIRPHLAKATESIIAVGNVLIRAKEALPHGEFGTLCTSLGMTTRTAQRFMAIARHPGLSNPTHASHLPPSWSTLAELAALEPDEVKRAIGAGRISPKTDRGAAKEVIASYLTARRRQAERHEAAQAEPEIIDLADQVEPTKSTVSEPTAIGPRLQRWKVDFGLHLGAFEGLTIGSVNSDFITTLTDAERADWIAACKRSEVGLRRFRRELEQEGGR